MEQWSAEDRKFAKELFFGWPGDFKPFVLGLINRARALRDAEREPEIAALQAENARLRRFVKDTASQKKTTELETEYDVECADFEGAYDHIIDKARAALGGENG